MMDQLDIEEIVRKNPHLDLETLDALRKSLHGIRRRPKPRYRLAPVGTHRVRSACQTRLLSTDAA